VVQVVQVVLQENQEMHTLIVVLNQLLYLKQ